MTLSQLVKGSTIQGNVWLTLWDNDGSDVIREEMICGTEDLKHAPELDGWRSRKIKYIFANDEWLHIEFEQGD